MPEQNIRLFVAVPIPKRLQAVMDDWCRQAKTHLPFQKWVHPEDYHITLQFLGDTPIERLQRLQETLQKAAGNGELKPFTLRLQGNGVFGSPAAPSIFWAGIGGDVDRLAELHQAVVTVMEPLGYKPEDRPFRAHLTLARKYAGDGRFDRQALDSLPEPDSGPGADGLAWKVGGFDLFVSRLGRSPMYESVGTFAFAE